MRLLILVVARKLQFIIILNLEIKLKIILIIIAIEDNLFNYIKNFVKFLT